MYPPTKCSFPLYIVGSDEAMDMLGYNVTVSISNVTIHGLPDTGKTSVIDLTMGRPPAEDRHSTGFAEPPSCSIIAAGDGSSEDGEWEMLPAEKMRDVLCKTMEKFSNPNPVSIDYHSLKLDTTGPEHEAEENILSLFDPLYCPPVHNEATKDVKRDYPQILRDLIKRLPVVNEPTTLSEARLILMSDSGGHPNYLDVFPLFICNKCLVIYTLKLNEQLDAIPKFSYFIQDRSIRIADTMLQYSYWQLLESLAKSMTSFFPSLSPLSQCRFTIVGTFADKMEECRDETIRDKNNTIANNLKAYEQLRVNYKGKPIFPIHAITSDEQQRKEYMLELRRLINKESPCIKVDIKLLWFVFYLSLQSRAKAKQRAILSLQECLDIGSSLDMDEQETRKAITFFHKLNLIFHCQSEELDNCFVIIDLKPIFDLVSNLIGVSFIDEQELYDFFCISLPPGVKEHFQKYGCFYTMILWRNAFVKNFLSYLMRKLLSISLLR